MASMNEPGEWRKEWTAGQTGIHPTYPTDGRETIHPPYEEHSPTTTVREYLIAARRAQKHDPDLPPGFNAYLSQRVPSTVNFGTTRIPLDSIIDRKGIVHRA